MSFLPVLEYLGGLCLFGFVYWLVDGIMLELSIMTRTGDTYDFLMFIWVGIIVFYLLIGGVWLVRKYTEPEYMER